MRKQHVLMWPASAMLTGNGVAFVLRVPGTAHGDWWSMRGWWIFAGTAAVSLLSKYVIKWRGNHIFNPSNIGLVLCFLLLGREAREPARLLVGPDVGLARARARRHPRRRLPILSRLKLLRVALAFWVTFAVGIGVLALAGHTMTARWHLGPIARLPLLVVLVTSPEVLVFLFFMITDPKTAPRAPRARLVYAVSLGLLAALLIAPMRTEYAGKVALLRVARGRLSRPARARALLRPLPRLSRPAARRSPARPRLAAFAACTRRRRAPSPIATAARAAPPGALPPITILPSQGVQTQLDLHTAQLIAHDLLVDRPRDRRRPADAAHLARRARTRARRSRSRSSPGQTYQLHQSANGHWALAVAAPAQVATGGPESSALAGLRLTETSRAQVGLDFRQGSFRYGMSNDYKAMMGGGVCWLDYNNDGWLDLFAVNSYSSADTDRSGTRTAACRAPRCSRTTHGTFLNVSSEAHADLPVQGDGCVAADLNGDGRTDLDRHDDDRHRPALEQRQRHVHRGRAAAGMTPPAGTRAPPSRT